MKKHILKALLGKYISKNNTFAYCHIDRIIVIEGNKAIATAIIKTLNERTLHWFIETAWSTDDYGVHTINNYKIMKEDELK